MSAEARTRRVVRRTKQNVPGKFQRQITHSLTHSVTYSLHALNTTTRYGMSLGGCLVTRNVSFIVTSLEVTAGWAVVAAVAAAADATTRRPRFRSQNAMS